MSPIAAFVTGLTTGGLTCLAVQGGLLLGLLARRDDSASHLPRWQWYVLPVAAFLTAKLAAHTLLGAGLGWLGDSIQLSQTARVWLQSLAGVFMVVTGIRLIVPQWLPWLAITPPAAVRRLIRSSAKSQLIFAPAVLGLLTLLIPCGTTQAMEVAAIAAGSAAQGAAVMFAFVLGTAPLFFLVGVLAKGTALIQRRLAFAAATVVIGLGLYTLNGVLVLTDSPWSFQNRLAAWRSLSTSADQSAATDRPVIRVLNDGYEPSRVIVPASLPVKLELVTDRLYSCTSIFTIPKLGLTRSLPQTGRTVITTTFPAAGNYTFACGMGMYSGTIEAI